MGDIAPNFNRIEFACTGWTKGGGSCGCKNKGVRAVDAELLKILQHLRDESGIRVNINSAFRCKARNKSEGGASNSQHLFGLAADIRVGQSSDPDELWTPDYVISWLRHHYPKASHGAYNSFTHIDVRPGGPTFWDNRKKKGAFPAYQPLVEIPTDGKHTPYVSLATLDKRVTALEAKCP